MVNAQINGIEIQVEKGTTILDAAREKGIRIPTLCYLKEINEIGACRVCLVEIGGKKNLVAACNNVVEEGMEIFTNSPKVQSARRTNVELILSQHDFRCASCVRGNDCNLQRLARELNIIEIPYKIEIENQPWDHSFPIIRDSAKCIKCMRCVQVCDKIQTMGVWDIINTGKRTSVSTVDMQNIEDMDCALCGQCITHCPTGALRERNDTVKVMDAIMDPDQIVIAQIAPAVRAAWGEGFGLSTEQATVGKMVSAARQIGFDYIFDTDFSADLTIMEEGHELLERLSHEKDAKMPMFTSCCPGWVRFMKSQFPDYVDNLSTAKSPQQMFGAIAKTYYADILGVTPDKITCVSIMPCMSKKRELTLPGMDSAGTGQDIDYVLTTREICRLIKADHIDVSRLPECDFDDPLGEATGAGVIFGASGGVLEAALRTAYHTVTGENPEIGEQSPLKVLRQIGSFKELEIDIKGVKLHCAALSSLGEARRLIQAMKRGECHYDFVEVMACPGGCINGGGQPIRPSFQNKPKDCADRDQCLRGYDARSAIRFSHENKAVQTLYDEYLEAPLSDRAHHLLHVEEY